jgi:purine-binding chemotaxis protein CheW
MNKKHRVGQRASLIDQRSAVKTYLDTLLQEVPETLSEPAPPKAGLAMQPSPVVVELPVAPVPEQVIVPAVPDVPTPQAGTSGAPPDQDGLVPEWAAEPFPSLLFKCAGLGLAVPLAKLNGVLPWPDELTPMPGHAPWFLGLHRYQDENVKVVDTAMLVLPKDRRAALLGESRSKPSNIILIGEGRWGLACDAVAEVVALDPKDVRWRTARSKRPWLAGTAVEHMCALLDADEFARILLTGEWVDET